MYSDVQSSDTLDDGVLLELMGRTGVERRAQSAEYATGHWCYDRACHTRPIRQSV